jgi:4-diphosphocytidyl-2-C-methyl-D-erythritol kinase
VSATLCDTARAKINLTLRVAGRRADGYHDLESLVAFADLADELTLEPGPATKLDVAGRFADACGAHPGNLVLKAARALGLPAGHFRLDKRIPIAAGLGGGSADAAAALRLIARANSLAPDDPRLASAALACGADVPVCLDSKPRVMCGRGDQLSPSLQMPKLNALLVNPGTPLATAKVFAAFTMAQAGSEPVHGVPFERDALFDWLGPRGNDLTTAAISLAPAIGQLLGEMAMLPGCRLARMSGSGATCFALFASEDETDQAARALRSKRPDWWVCRTTLT